MSLTLFWPTPSPPPPPRGSSPPPPAHCPGTATCPRTSSRLFPPPTSLTACRPCPEAAAAAAAAAASSSLPAGAGEARRHGGTGYRGRSIRGSRSRGGKESFTFIPRPPPPPQLCLLLRRCLRCLLRSALFLQGWGGRSMWPHSWNLGSEGGARGTLSPYRRRRGAASKGITRASSSSLPRPTRARSPPSSGRRCRHPLQHLILASAASLTSLLVSLESCRLPRRGCDSCTNINNLSRGRW